MVESGRQHAVVLLHALPFDSEMRLPVRRQLELDRASVVAPKPLEASADVAEIITSSVLTG